MIGKNKVETDAMNEYREVRVKPSIYTMLVAVTIVAAPLGWLNQKIGAEGFRIADTTQYRNLVDGVGRDVKAVQRMLDSERMDEVALKGVPVVTLITPDIMPTNMGEAVQSNGKLNIELSAIYWNSHDPIATINGENYHVGEFINGYKIIEIRKTEVVFEDPMGEKVIIYFYDYLDQGKKRR